MRKNGLCYNLKYITYSLMTKFRKLENLEAKIINRKWSQIFNNILIKEKNIPINICKKISKINRLKYETIFTSHFSANILEGSELK